MGLYKSKRLSDAKRTCDKWFSYYIRLRDSNPNGMCRCITCDKVKHWKEMDTGHFQSRRFLLTRYDERNANGQCQNCNQWNSGEQYKHGLAVDDKFGEGTAQELENKARGMQKMTKQDVMELAREFKTMAEEIAEQKGIQI